MRKEEKDLQVVNVRIPSEIVSWLDSLVKRGVYNSRAEAIREFCRSSLKRKVDP